MPITLRAEHDVARRSGALVATGIEPWLAIDGLVPADLAGRFVSIVYSASFWDRPSRPLFRFWQANGSFVDRIASGPVAGSGIWVGRVPVETHRISVSPTNQVGIFDFRIESIRLRSWPAVMLEGLRWNRKSARSALLTRLIGWRPESDVNLAWAISSRPLSSYATWLKRRHRPLDLTGLDRPRADWTAVAPIQLFLTGGADVTALRRTIASLEAQIFARWHACIVDAPYDAPDDRVMCLPLSAASARLAGLESGVLSAVLRAGDVLKPEALAIVAERAARQETVSLFYGDETRPGSQGPELVAKPGWSPRLQAARPYVGLGFVRGQAARTYEDRCLYLTTGDLPPSFVASVAGESVVPLRRVLVERALVERAEVIRTPARVIPVPVVQATVTIIICTRDHPALLQRVVTSIRAKSSTGRYDIVVVDNGSVDPEAVALMDRLRDERDTRVRPHPGPFNFSLMCNEAAATSSTDVLVFLNDDMEVLSEGWLDRLVAHAMDPNVGAVGAKLTYPDGRIQHVGVLVGMGESAGHFGALAPGDDPGWAGRNEAVHEVSAVTGACLAVAREKFEAVGGFDAEHLPIELSDIDLCLKLNARGWQTLVDPFVHIMHEESVSRGGATLRRLDVYGSQRAVFVERWRRVLRDDPAFHPGLSLYRWHAALG